MSTVFNARETLEPPAGAVLISTRNQHKVQEIRDIFPSDYALLSLAQFPGAPEVIEDGKTFAENSAKKASSLAAWIASRGIQITWAESPPGVRLVDIRIPAEGSAVPYIPNAQKLFILADDSGLEVDALNGAPGVHSARFSVIDQAEQTANAPDADNNAKLLRLLEGVPLEKRTARFRCVLAWIDVGGDLKPKFFEGACEGRIDFRPSGTKGFGYDPLFVPDGYSLSFADLGEEIKNSKSHRAQALNKLVAHLKSS